MSTVAKRVRQCTSLPCPPQPPAVRQPQSIRRALVDPAAAAEVGRDEGLEVRNDGGVDLPLEGHHVQRRLLQVGPHPISELGIRLVQVHLPVVTLKQHQVPAPD